MLVQPASQPAIWLSCLPETLTLDIIHWVCLQVVLQPVTYTNSYQHRDPQSSYWGTKKEKNKRKKTSLTFTVFHTVHIQERYIQIEDLTKKGSGWHLDVYEPISFKLDVVMVTVKVHSLMLVEWWWPTFKFKGASERETTVLIYWQSSLLM